jgi:hypothetical protein
MCIGYFRPTGHFILMSAESSDATVTEVSGVSGDLFSDTGLFSFDFEQPDSARQPATAAQNKREKRIRFINLTLSNVLVGRFNGMAGREINILS